MDLCNAFRLLFLTVWWILSRHLNVPTCSVDNMHVWALPLQESTWQQYQEVLPSKVNLGGKELKL